MPTSRYSRTEGIRMAVRQMFATAYPRGPPPGPAEKCRSHRLSSRVSRLRREYRPVVRLPQMAGEIERRLLVNYRVEPAALTRLLPAQLRPQLVDGLAVAGICLIRLGGLRPRGLPSLFGLTTENAAHRIAVEWEQDGISRRGVFIPRRDSSSRLTCLLGGRVFPGAHQYAQFSVEEQDDLLHVAFRSQDGTTEVEVRAAIEPTLSNSRLFADVGEASRFFEQGEWACHPAGTGRGSRPCN